MSALLTIFTLVALTAEPTSVPPPVHRLAVLVGANEAPPGRQPLRYAYRDARSLRDALVRVGGVAEADAMLLLDPRPAEVLASLARLSAQARAEPGETVLYFYYSGHADETSFYPGGAALPIQAIRQALVAEGATVRVGIFDACRGGAWTRAKGLSPGPPVDLRPPWALGAEGTVLFASSSGLEEAHESDQLQGSFFTHALVGGLLGAADASGDGAVTATEAFQYAQAQTVRDSSRAALDPQHPSFELNLHGRRDLVMARLESGASTLDVRQTEGPLQVVELPLGLVLLELPQGKRTTRLSVAPGAYLIRRVGEGGVVTAREVQVAQGETTSIQESSLELVGAIQLERKGPSPLPRVRGFLAGNLSYGASTAVGAGGWGVTADVGVQLTEDWALYASQRATTLLLVIAPTQLSISAFAEWTSPVRLSVALGLGALVTIMPPLLGSDTLLSAAAAIPLRVAYDFGTPSGLRVALEAGVSPIFPQPFIWGGVMVGYVWR